MNKALIKQAHNSDKYYVYYVMQYLDYELQRKYYITCSQDIITRHNKRRALCYAFEFCLTYVDAPYFIYFLLH